MGATVNMNQLVNSKGEPSLSMTGAARVLGVSRQAVSQMVARGRLPAERYQLAGGAGVGVISVAAVQSLRRQRQRQMGKRTATARKAVTSG